MIGVGHVDQAEGPRVRGTTAADQRLRHAALVGAFGPSPAAVGTRTADPATRPRRCCLRCRNACELLFHLLLQKKSAIV